MSKIKIYLLILAVAIIAVALGYMMHIKPTNPFAPARPDLYEKPGPAGYCRCLRLFYSTE